MNIFFVTLLICRITMVSSANVDQSVLMLQAIWEFRIFVGSGFFDVQMLIFLLRMIKIEILLIQSIVRLFFIACKGKFIKIHVRLLHVNRFDIQINKHGCENVVKKREEE